MELHKIIYDLLVTQIQFGTYKYKDPLPKMADISQWFFVSLDTVKAAYHLLKKDGYITLTKRAGAIVNIQLEASELDSNIQTFFAARHESIIGLCQAFTPLFSHVQWYSMKYAGPEQLDALEALCSRTKILRPYLMVQHIHLIFGSLNNDLLLKLIWYAFLFYQAPFLSLPANLTAFEDYDEPLRKMIGQSRKKDWKGLWQTIVSSQKEIESAIHWFYTYRIPQFPNKESIPFTWNTYQNTSQRCYSLAIEILKGIRWGSIAQDGFLPAPAKLADYMQVSVITIRRTIKLLNQLGVTQSVNGVGTKILSIEQSKENCDFSQPFIRKRLLNFVQSLQILAMTCGPCSKNVISDPAAVKLWKQRLIYTKENFRYESVVYGSIEIILRYTKNQTIRQVYEHLVSFLLWGYPLRSMHGSRKEINAFYLPYINLFLGCLERSDWDRLAAELEKLMFYELQFAATRLDELGIKDALSLVIQPDHKE